MLDGNSTCIVSSRKPRTSILSNSCDTHELRWACTSKRQLQITSPIVLVGALLHSTHKLLFQLCGLQLEVGLSFFGHFRGIAEKSASTRRTNQNTSLVQVQFFGDGNCNCTVLDSHNEFLFVLLL